MSNSLDSAYEVIYLTGAPATGKSTLARELRKQVRPLSVFEYGQQLTAYLNARDAQTIKQSELRRHSAALVTPEDVRAVDRQLLAFVAEQRRVGHVLIDTHAVTKESYGFRVTPYSLEDITALRPTMIVLLYTAPEVAIERITADPAGRPLITSFEAGFHTALQSSVAVAYATALGIPVYLLDAVRPTDALVHEIEDRIARRAARNAGQARSTPVSSE